MKWDGKEFVGHPDEESDVKISKNGFIPGWHVEGFEMSKAIEYKCGKCGATDVKLWRNICSHALGRSAGLQWGRVDEIRRQEVCSYSCPNGVKIVVQGISESWRAPELNCRKGLLLYPDRIVAVEPSRVPEAIVQLLSEAKP